MRLDLEPDEDLAALVRGAVRESLVIVIPSTLDALAMAQARAIIGPLAVELAPATRVNAVVPAEDCDPVDVDAAVAFLENAPSTTGQLLQIHKRDL